MPAQIARAVHRRGRDRGCGRRRRRRHRRVASREIRAERRSGRRRRRPRRKRLSRGDAASSRRSSSFASGAAFRPSAGKPGGTSNKSGRSGEDLTIRGSGRNARLSRARRAAEDFCRRSQRARRARRWRPRAVAAASAISTSPRASVKRRVSPNAASPASAARCGSSCACSPIAESSAFQTPESRRCSRSFRPRVRRSPTIRSRRSNRSSASCASPTRNRSSWSTFPGLIEGAHEGIGLRRSIPQARRAHARACCILLDGAKPLDEILADKATIEAELARVESRAARKADAARAQQARSAERARIA